MSVCVCVLGTGEARVHVVFPEARFQKVWESLGVMPGSIRKNPPFLSFHPGLSSLRHLLNLKKVLSSKYPFMTVMEETGSGRGLMSNLTGFS